MSEFELPEFVDRDTLHNIDAVEVPDEAILNCFVVANKPWLSKSAVAEMTSLGDEAVRKRLNSLEDRGVLRSETAGKQTKIYWLNDPRSAWPIPDDIHHGSLDDARTPVKTVTRINRVSTITVFYGGLFAVLIGLDWLSSLPVTDGVISFSLAWSIFPMLSFGLLGVLFYVTLQTSLVVENKDVGWPTIRRMYRRVAG